MWVPRIVVTSGEPAGIGPDTCVALAQLDWPADLVVAADASLMAEVAAALHVPLRIERYEPSRPGVAHRAGVLKVLHLPTAQPVAAGTLDPRNAPYVIGMLDRACDGCMNGEFAAMVTAPVQKSALMDAGYAFSGHTEYLAARSRAALPVMMLVNGQLRVALVTTHLPLAEVPRAITAERLRATLRIVHIDLGRHFALGAPRIAVLGLNPHAGESGHLGREEIEVIEPVIRAAAGRRAECVRSGTRRYRVHASSSSPPPMWWWRCITIRACRSSNMPASETPSTSLSGCRSCAPASITARRSALARTGKADPGSLRAALALAIELASASTAHGGS